MKTMTWREFRRLYCDTQVATPSILRGDLEEKIKEFQPEGFVLLRCEMFGSYYFGQHTILPYGPNNTFKAPPDHPISPRGLASDMSVVVGILPINEFLIPAPEKVS